MQHQALQAIASGQTMTSLEIVDLVNAERLTWVEQQILAGTVAADFSPEILRHDNLMVSVRRLQNSGHLQSVSLQVFGRINELGLTVPQEIATFSGEAGMRDCVVLIARVSPEHTGRIFDRWVELERLVRSGQFISIADHEQAMARLSQERLVGPAGRPTHVHEIPELRPWLGSQGRPLVVSGEPEGYLPVGSLGTFRGPFTAGSFRKYALACGARLVFWAKGQRSRVTLMVHAGDCALLERAGLANGLLRREKVRSDLK